MTVYYNCIITRDMILGKIVGMAFCCINFLCCTVAKYLLVNIQEEHQETSTGISDDEYYQWKDLENNEKISLSSRGCNKGCRWLNKACAGI